MTTGGPSTPPTPPSPPSPFLTVAATATAPTPAGEDVLLDVRDVWQKLGGNQILEGVTLQVKDRVRPGQVTGQVVALLGPSGVGKTRLIRLIPGWIAPIAVTSVVCVPARCPPGRSASCSRATPCCGITPCWAT